MDLDLDLELDFIMTFKLILKSFKISFFFLGIGNVELFSQKILGGTKFVKFLLDAL